MVTVNTFKENKGKKKMTMLTAYDYLTAKNIDEAGIDSILVGDSLGMVMLGYPNTLAVTLEDMIHHGAAVVRGAKNAMVVVDMPFMSYQVSKEEAIRNAGRLMKETGCQAVKIEGAYIEEIKAIVKAGIPVVGHLGLTPQSVNSIGGYKVQGKQKESAIKLIEDCIKLQEAGCFAITLECVPRRIAEYITKILHISTIGIGASNECDCQVLVWQDMTGYTDAQPAKFVKKFANLHDEEIKAFTEYKNEVESMEYPAKEHTYMISDEIYDEVIKEVEGK
ncbi:MAG: 3-methyl-2-oxobutanoate hydroxymethyltransferase [Acholeplasmatales bacterium]|nr:3-methyl-2-oxobutanoate hydroxymethyltransferase [Acholeplasmatales bacterium]